MDITGREQQAIRKTEAVAVQPSAARRGVSRRKVMLAGFWAAIGTMVAAAGGTLTNMLYPRNVAGFGGPIGVPANLVPGAGDPPREILAGRFLLVHLRPNEGRLSGDDTAAPGGLLALYRKCPHLGCTVPWRANVELPTSVDQEKRRGWFQCPCHQSTYTKAGVRQWGPAPRSMDTMSIEVQPSGALVVQTGQIAAGDTDNPQRAVPYAPPAAGLDS